MRIQVEQGHYSMQDLVIQFDIRLIKEEQLQGIDMEYELRNINSMEDLKDLE